MSQFAISYTIFCFGAVTLASVMTFRQFLSVVISSFIFGNPLSGLQWLGVLMVLVPVFERVYTRFENPHSSARPRAGTGIRRTGTRMRTWRNRRARGLGYGPRGQIPDNYFSARGTECLPEFGKLRGGVHVPEEEAPRGVFSPRSSISDGAVRSNMSDVEKPANTNERSKLLKR